MEVAGCLGDLSQHFFGKFLSFIKNISCFDVMVRLSYHKAFR